MKCGGEGVASVESLLVSESLVTVYRIVPQYEGEELFVSMVVKVRCLDYEYIISESTEGFLRDGSPFHVDNLPQACERGGGKECKQLLITSHMCLIVRGIRE
ncbi:hypothetical protein TNCV_976941 [Trichonephila clavipes]|nr:hypothetical protein TNCV_976941 [Trichonephila clavipes]